MSARGVGVALIGLGSFFLLAILACRLLFDIVFDESTIVFFVLPIVLVILGLVILFGPQKE
jgi:hypothetical protein